MDKSEEKKPESSKADLLRTAMSKSKGKCEKCSHANKEAMSPMISALLSKLGFLGLPGMSGGCPHAHGAVVVVKKEIPTAPNADEPDGQKKVLEKEKTETTQEDKHRTSPFVLRCVAAMTYGKPATREEESRAFAICNAQKNKSERDLDKDALKRPGFKSRKDQFVKSLEAIKKRKKQKGHEF
jgi:hypothetical protein